MKKKLLIILMLFFILSGCTKAKAVKPLIEEPKIVKENNLNIETTNYLLYDLVKTIVEDKNDVSFMFKNEADQWNFNFTNDSIHNINKKDIFFYTGGGFEPWIGDFIDSLNKNKVLVLNVSRGTKIIDRDTNATYLKNDKPVTVKDNPYYWMDIDKYQIALFNVVKTIEDKDPKNKKFYDENYHLLESILASYEKRFKDIKKGLKDYTLVVQDDSLDYFTSYLNMKVIKLPVDFNPEDTSENTHKILDKFTNNDKLILLQTSDKAYVPKLINTYGMKVSEIIAYQYKLSFINMLEQNCKNLERWIIPISDG